VKMTALLVKREFRHFFLADMISGFGVGLTTVGANWYVLQMTHSNRIVGLYLTVNVLVGFLMAPLAGILTDRLSRKAVILWTFLGRALPMMVIALFIWRSGFSLWSMALLASVTGAGWITYMAASRSYVQAILPTDLLGTANAFIEISLQVGMFAAGAVAGIILNYTGFTTVLVLSIMLLLVAAGLIATIPKNESVLAPMTADDQQTGFIAGIRYIGNQHLIFSIGMLSILPLIVTQLFNVTAPDYVVTILKSNSVVYGLTDMSYGIGGLVAGMVTGFLIAKVAERRLISWLFGLATLGLVVLTVTRLIPVTLACTFSLGLSNSALRVVINTVLMKRVASEYMGRTTAVWNGTAQLIEGFASTLLGFTNDSWGANIGFLLMAIIMLIGVVWSIKVLSKADATV